MKTLGLLERDYFYSSYTKYIDFLKVHDEILIWGNGLSSANISEVLDTEEIWYKVSGFVSNDKTSWGKIIN